MSRQESEGPMQEGIIPVPIGDEIITFRGRMIEIVTQQMRVGLEEVVYEKARRSPGTRLLITSPNHNILLTREYRDEVGGWDYRLPGGKVFDSLEEYSEAVKSGVDLLEKSKQAAQKEAQEEVGIDAEGITHLYTLAMLADIESIIFVGSSFVGKTTLVDVTREAINEDPDTFRQFRVPKRIITRPQRQGDNLVENEFRTLDEFREMVARGEIGMHWVRKMKGTRTEQYGFLPVEPGVIPLYSANNAVINNRESVNPGSLLEKSLIIAIYAPEDIRRRRLFERSPDLVNEKPEEVAYRLEDRAINMYPDAHIVVKNFGKYEQQTKDDVVTLMKLISLTVTQ